MKKILLVLALLFFLPSVARAAVSGSQFNQVAPGMEISIRTFGQYVGVLDDLVTTIGTQTIQILIDIPITLRGPVTMPSNIAIRFLYGGMIVNNGFALTINGPVIAPAVPIFSGAGVNTVNLAGTPQTVSTWGTFTTTGVPPTVAQGVILLAQSPTASAPVGPGPGLAVLRLRNGTSPGTCKLTVSAGNSYAQEVTLADNIPAAGGCSMP